MGGGGGRQERERECARVAQVLLAVSTAVSEFYTFHSERDGEQAYADVSERLADYAIRPDHADAASTTYVIYQNTRRHMTQAVNLQPTAENIAKTTCLVKRSQTTLGGTLLLNTDWS